MVANSCPFHEWLYWLQTAAPARSITVACPDNVFYELLHYLYLAGCGVEQTVAVLEQVFEPGRPSFIVPLDVCLQLIIDTRAEGERRRWPC